jgi:mRNA export factor
MVFSGGCDKKVIAWDLGSTKNLQVGVHDAPVNFVTWFAPQKAVLSGSWDKSLRYWDLRQPTPALKIDLPERLYSADVKGQLGIFGTADRKILIFDMAKPQTPFRTVDSPLKFQTRVVRAWPNGGGFAAGSIEGRVAMHAIEQSQTRELNFAFKCHRVKSNIFAVNDLSFSKYGSFATVGGDGSVHYWCKESRTRLKQFKRANLPLTCCGFNGDCSIFAYAASYDWQKGAGGYNQAEMKPHIYLKGVQDADIRPKPPGSK